MMEFINFFHFMLLTIIIINCLDAGAESMSVEEKTKLRNKVLEMFHHAYSSYMDHAYPADELMPLSCKGRYRNTEPSRGDIDDALGNFSLTLVDTLDTLVVLGKVDEFERVVKLVIADVSFDSDIVVSVFETNIRMLGGLLGGHVMAHYLKRRRKGMAWYKDELLDKAKDLGYRLIPAFNTTTGMPFPRVNLRYGVKHEMSRTGHEKDTCTACAGTMILEFSALSRLTGEPIFEEKAQKAMEYLWKSRHRTSDLVGTVINIHNGDWVRRESGVGAGIDSYYEYLFKAYILLGDDTYLERFNKHYSAVMKYISQGPLMVDVHMHKPLTNSRNFMDALLAFWPGLQVLKGDIKPAIETHEMLYQIIQKHNFLPEAFTTDFRVHWGQHPLRPEFLESTYFLFKATGDPHYLEVGREVMDNLEKHARVDCGYAAIKDVTMGTHEDQMDSFVLAETFKYLYLLFSEKSDLILDIDDFIFTTEAHLLPLTLSIHNSSAGADQFQMSELLVDGNGELDDDTEYERSCPNSHHVFQGNYAESFRNSLKNMVENSCPASKASCKDPHPRQASAFNKHSTPNTCTSQKRKPKLRASEFMAGNKLQVETLKLMGIRVITMNDGRVQLLHTAAEAATPEDAEDGMLFMQQMIELSKHQASEVQQEPRVVQYMPPPYFGHVVLNAGPAQFGRDVRKSGEVKGKLIIGAPLRMCQPPDRAETLKGKVVIVERGDCMFVDKARHLQEAGAVGGIVIDNNEGTSSETQPLFAMSGDGKDDVTIPILFLFHVEGQKLLEVARQIDFLQVYLGYQAKTSEEIIQDLLTNEEQRAKVLEATKDGTVFTGLSWTTQPSQSDADHASQSDAASDGGADDLSQSASGLVGASSSEVPAIQMDTVMKLAGGGAGGSNRQIRLHLEKAEGKGGMEAVVEELVAQLTARTNFQSLALQQSYLEALGKMLAALGDGKYEFLDSESVDTLKKLALELAPDGLDDGEGEAAEKLGEEEGGSAGGGTAAADDVITMKLNKALDEYIVEQINLVVGESVGGRDAGMEPEGAAAGEGNGEGECPAPPLGSSDTLRPYATEEDFDEEIFIHQGSAASSIEQRQRLRQRRDSGYDSGEEQSESTPDECSVRTSLDPRLATQADPSLDPDTRSLPHHVTSGQSDAQAQHVASSSRDQHNDNDDLQNEIRSSPSQTQTQLPDATISFKVTKGDDLESRKVANVDDQSHQSKSNVDSDTVREKRATDEL